MVKVNATTAAAGLLLLGAGYIGWKLNSRVADTTDEVSDAVAKALEKINNAVRRVNPLEQDNYAYSTGNAIVKKLTQEETTIGAKVWDFVQPDDRARDECITSPNGYWIDYGDGRAWCDYR